MRHVLSVVASALLVLTFSAPVAGQSFTGGIRGAVRDSNGIIPGVVVQLTNEGTGDTREAVTNAVGEYNFTALPPGAYMLRAELAGFRAHESTGLRVGTSEFLTIDVLLEVGAVEETITVTGETPLIETSNASTGEVLSRQELEILPAPGRNAFLVGVTVPAVVTTGDPQFNRQQDQSNASLVSLGGGTIRGNNYVLDGVSVVDMQNRSVLNPSIEGLEEVKVQIHTFDAEMGRTGGGVFNITMKSGTNEFHGSGFFQTRPVWGLQNNWFLDRQGIPKAEDQYYRLYGGGVGGPIIRNRTFWWFATEGYRSLTTRNGQLILPTAAQRQGDFSQSGVQITDPRTGNPFPGNVIPADRFDQVGKALIDLFPTPDENIADQVNYRRTASIIDAADQTLTKITHRFSDTVSLSGFYNWNKTDEPFAEYWDVNAFADPGATPLRRRIHVLATNGTIIPNDTTVLTLRYGLTSFRDDNIPDEPFDITTLPFDPSFLNDIFASQFPGIDADDVGEVGGDTMGPGTRTERRWKSWQVNGTLSKLAGRHTLKTGVEFRRLGVENTSFGSTSGTFAFGTGDTGHSLASLLLGLPRSGSAVIPPSNEFYLDYYGAYVQDDFRVNSRLTLNFGVRFESESGLYEVNDAFTTGFCTTCVNPLNTAVGPNTNGQSIESVLGRQLLGGVMYPGQNGGNDYQGNQPGQKWSPRLGVVYSLDDDTVVRGGYGVFWAPWNYPSPGTTSLGQIGYSATTAIYGDSLQNPFPQGLTQPTGSSLGLLTGVGEQVIIVDQDKGAPRVQQFSMDLQRELPGNMALSVTYMHARGDDLSLGGASTADVDRNALTPEQLALGADFLTEDVPNPFLGLADAGSLGLRDTVSRGQLLRPFPQFDGVIFRGVTEGRARYHAVVTQIEKRVSGNWGGRINYTWSRKKDNLFAASNTYADNGEGRPQNPYDLDAEYAHSIDDMPHRIVVAPIIQLPFGVGQPYLNTGGLSDLILGGWRISAVLAFEAGFPSAVAYSRSFTQRTLGIPRLGNTPAISFRPDHTGTDPQTSGGTIERVDPGPWVDEAAYQLPAGLFGTAERTDTRVRTPWRNNLDVVFAKNIRTGGTSQAQLRLELLNITGTPKFRSYNTLADQGTFGLITRQGGFMRIWQISFRFTF